MKTKSFVEGTFKLVFRAIDAENTSSCTPASLVAKRRYSANPHSWHDSFRVRHQPKGRNQRAFHETGVRWGMPRVNYFAIAADVPERAITFYQEVFGWRFEVGWEYDTPQGHEKYWH